MPSSLVNPKMNPALASRVTSSLRGKRGSGPATPTSPSRTLLIRLGALAAVSAIALAVVREVQTRNEQLRGAKQALLLARAELQSTLTPRARAIGERVTRLLTREANSYHGAVRHEQLGGLADWDALLSRPIVYARVEVDKVSQPERFDAALSESRKDAFVACLKQPPEGRGEKELMKRVTDAFGQGAQEYTSNLHRVHDALVTLRVLDPAIDRQIERAEELQPVISIQHTWDQAHIDERLPAVFGEIVIALLDEPKVKDTPVELDGASVHGVRLIVVDISREQDQVLLRTHFDLNPSWVSERRRHQYAQGLEACRMAYDVRTALAQPR
jgi:hypothetical protein